MNKNNEIDNHNKKNKINLINVFNLSKIIFNYIDKNFIKFKIL